VGDAYSWDEHRGGDTRFQSETGQGGGNVLGEFNLTLVTKLWYYSEPQVLQDINTAEGIDEILQEIREIKKLRKSQIASPFFVKMLMGELIGLTVLRVKYWIT
jgi:hypothetical protein